MKKLALYLLLPLFALSVFVLPAYAASSTYLQRATVYFQKNCKSASVSNSTALECYVFDKVSELSQSVTTLTNRVANIETTTSNHNNRITQYETTISPIPSQISTMQASINLLEEKDAAHESFNGQVEYAFASVNSKVNAIPSNYAWVSHQSIEANSSNGFTINDVQFCPPGKMVISGGVKTTHGNTLMTWSAPETSSGSSYPNGWRAIVTNRPADGTTYTAMIYALCATVPQ